MDRELDKLRNIRIEDYTYNLPDERIAKFPLAEREASKLLIYRGGRIEESRFSEVRRLLRAGQMLVFNRSCDRSVLSRTVSAGRLCSEFCSS